MALAQKFIEPYSAEEFHMVSLSSPGTSEDRDRTLMRSPAQARFGVHFGSKYVWDAMEEIIRLQGYSDDQNPDYQLLLYEIPSLCGLFGESGHRVNTCSLRDLG